MRKFNNITDVNAPLTIPPKPLQMPPKKEKIKRLYEDNDFVIDLFVEDNTLRVSIFEDGHFKDEIFINKENYIR